MHRLVVAILTFFTLAQATADTEPNDTWQNALSLPQDRTVGGNQADDDWYVINISSNQTVQRILIDLTFTHADGNIDVRVYGDDFVASNPTGTLPGLFRDVSDGNATDHEFVDHNVTPTSPETYFIQVLGANQGNAYTLTWTEVSGADDGFEENDSNAAVRAITANAVNFAVQSDEDWYSIEVPSGNTRVLASLRFFNTHLSATIDMDMTLRDSGGTPVPGGSSTNPAGSNEDISVVVAPGTYHLQITGDNAGEGYALTWAAVAPASGTTFPAPAVNEVPQAVANTVSTEENNPYQFTASDFTFTDSEGDSLVSATLSNLSLGGGSLIHSGSTPVSNQDTLSAAQLGTLVYTPPADSAASPLATFSFTVNDLDAGTVAAQMDIDVTASTTAAPASSNGAMAPAWLLVLMTVGLLRNRLRIRRE